MKAHRNRYLVETLLLSVPSVMYRSNILGLSVVGVSEVLDVKIIGIIGIIGFPASPNGNLFA